MRLLRNSLSGAVLCCLAVLPALAQDRQQTLADIRQQLSVVYVEVQKLKQELSTTGGVATLPDTGSPLQRLNAIEGALQVLTAKAEQLEFRIDTVVTDGTNRIGDLEFRLCELEEGCDIAALGDTPTLGGVEVAMPAAPLAPPGETGAQMAVGEQADYDRARAALEAGEFRAAADQFAAFAQAYPGGPLSGEAHFYRGVALGQLGETTNAARAYLESFSGAPQGPVAPQALYGLGIALNELGQTREACVTLGEVGTRFPDAAVTLDANAAISTIGCN